MLFLSSLYFCFDNALTPDSPLSSVPLYLDRRVNQVLEEDVSVVNPMISSALRAAFMGRGELASVKSIS